MTLLEVLGLALIVIGAGCGIFVFERVRYEWRLLREQKRRRDPPPVWAAPFDATTIN